MINALPSLPSRLDHSNYYWWRVQITKLLVMQISSPSSQFIPLWMKYAPWHPVLNTLSLCSSLNVRDQVSHPYRTSFVVVQNSLSAMVSSTTMKWIKVAQPFKQVIIKLAQSVLLQALF
jgi:hypothetical protein